MRKLKRPILTASLAAAGGAATAVMVRNFVAGEKKIKHRLRHRYAVNDPQFERSLGQLLGPPILEGNEVTPLQNGDEIFPAMLESIRNAERSITFETFIYWQGRIAEAFADALAERARAEVKTHVLIDAVGCDSVNAASLSRMKEAGVELELFHRRQFSRFNHRTHRKLLVIDGRIGFTGGVGIADQWDGNAASPEEWRDCHYRVTGPAVAQLQAAFMDNWLKTRAIVLHGEEYFPPLQTCGGLRCQMFKSGPQEGSDSARLMYHLAISSAQNSILLANAYFVPDDLTIETMVQAARQGVNIEVILPNQHIDKSIVRQASRWRWGDLLNNGIRIYEFQPTMFHCKYMVVDGLLTSVGSTNFDNRSFRLNAEANLNVLDAGFAAAHTEIFHKDKQHSNPIDYSQWKRRPLWEKTRDAASNLLRSQL